MHLSLSLSLISSYMFKNLSLMNFHLSHCQYIVFFKFLVTRKPWITLKVSKESSNGPEPSSSKICISKNVETPIMLSRLKLSWLSPEGSCTPYRRHQNNMPSYHFEENSIEVRKPIGLIFVEKKIIFSRINAKLSRIIA